MNYFLKFLAFCAIWMSTDFYINHLTRVSPFWGGLSKYTDHTHYFLYGILGIYTCFEGSPITFFLFLSWCFLDEGIQFFMPDRIPDWLDVLRNIVGYFGGYIIVDFFRKWKQKDGRERDDTGEIQL